MTDENIHVGELLKQFIKYWKIYVPIGITTLLLECSYWENNKA